MSDTENKNSLFKWFSIQMFKCFHVLAIKKQELYSCCGSSGVTYCLKVWLVWDLWMFLKILQSMLWVLCAILIEIKD